MKISLNGNLKWEKNDWFDKSSLNHALSGLLFTLLFQAIFKNNKPILIIIVSNLLHAFEDLLENTTINGHTFGVEMILSNVTNCQNIKYLDTRDHDTLQNYLGDIISYCIGSIIAYFIYNPLSNLIERKIWSYPNLFMGIIAFIIIIIYFFIIVSSCKKSQRKSS